MKHAGRTTENNNIFNFVGNPVIIKARNRNVVPLTAVPTIEVRTIVI